MPITPLHLGLLAPINHFFPKKVSNAAFIWVTLWMDANAIAYYAMGLEMGELHGPLTHSFVGALFVASLVAIFGCLSKSWLLGAYLGGISHVFLDMLVHAEMQPLYPLKGNPFYWGDMGPLSLILIPPFIWLTAQYVSGGISWLRKIFTARRQTQHP